MPRGCRVPSLLDVVVPRRQSSLHVVASRFGLRSALVVMGRPLYYEVHRERICAGKITIMIEERLSKFISTVSLGVPEAEEENKTVAA